MNLGRIGMRTILRVTMIFIMLSASCIPALATSDPSGAATLANDPNSPVNFAWVLICGILVMLMQLGFAMLECGLTRAKNAVNIVMKNLMDFCCGSIAYWAIGFALMMGTTTGITGMFFGTNGFFLAGDSYDVNIMKIWFWQMVFCATSATIVSGAMAERTKFSSYLLASVIISALIYPIYGHWVWGGGWLAASEFMKNIGGGYGALDFAGSGVVHMVGGFISLAGAYLVGARLGKYKPDGTPRAMPGHSLTTALFGVFILWFGWYGFNAGSTLAATELRISAIVVNTTLAAVFGATTTMLVTWLINRKPDASMTMNGVLAGLVGITAGCAWVSPMSAAFIGITAGIIVVIGIWFIDNVLHIDDPVGAISVHGLSGAWGLLALGIFADGTYQGVKGLLYGNPGFLACQIISIIACATWAFSMGFLMFWLLKKTIGLRVDAQEELRGSDIESFGTSAYQNFTPHHHLTAREEK